MFKDVIVQEVRKAGEDLAKRANYNLHSLFQNLRSNEKKSRVKVVSKLKDKKLKEAV